MRFHVLASILAVTSFAYVGCAAHTEETAASSDEALSDNALVGAYNVQPGFTADFSHFVLRADGSYFTETLIQCIKAPCINPREDGHWTSTRFTHTTLGDVTLHSNKGPSRTYHVSLAGDHTGLKLQRYGVVAGFDRVTTWCDTTADCSGQPTPISTQLCMVGYSHQTACSDQHTCVSKCAPTPECTVDADCRLFDDYCTGCDCRALSASKADPTCSGPGVRCLREPCGGKTAACTAGKCVVH